LRSNFDVGATIGRPRSQEIALANVEVGVLRRPVIQRRFDKNNIILTLRKQM